MNQRTILFTAFAFLLACSGGKPDAGDNPSVTVSILPQKYFVEQIAGSTVDVNVMIPPGASPATYEPSPSQLEKLSRSELYFRVGHIGFESAWMDRMQKVNPAMDVVDLSEGIDLIGHDPHGGSHDRHHHRGINPHIWLAPSTVKKLSGTITDRLAERFPEEEGRFRENMRSFEKKLDSLDRYIRSELQDLDSRSFFIYHPSLAYYARDYNLEQVPMELEGKSPSSAYLKNLADQGKEKGIGVIFLQMQFDQHNAEVLARETGAEIVQINPLDPAWYEQMIAITDKLKMHLQ